MNQEQIKNIVEAALLVAGRPVGVNQLLGLFDETEQPPTRSQIRSALGALHDESESRAVELVEVAGGFRYQARAEYAAWTSKLWPERPPRYSRAFMETLALIAYRQPITRGEIEDVRGVGVSTSIIKTLLELEWIRVLGHRQVPGRPAIFGTTPGFLDHFNLKSLDSLPPLAELRDLGAIEEDLFSTESANESSTRGATADAEVATAV